MIVAESRGEGVDAHCPPWITVIDVYVRTEARRSSNPEVVEVRLASNHHAEVRVASNPNTRDISEAKLTKENYSKMLLSFYELLKS